MRGYGGYGLGLLLLLIGGVLVLAVTAEFPGVDRETLGYVLIGGGVLAILISAITSRPARASSRTRSVDDAGRARVVERDERLS